MSVARDFTLSLWDESLPVSAPPSPSIEIPPWIRVSAQGAEVELLVQPRASRTRVVGIHDQRLKLQLAAPPVDGAANEALVAFVADALDVPQRQVSLVRGETNRRKTLLIQSVPPEQIIRTLAGSLS